MSGLVLRENASSREAAVHVPTYGDAATVATALARGADKFLTKRVHFPKLKQDIMAVKADVMPVGRMTAPPDDTTTDLHAAIAALRAERDAALAREAALAKELAARDATLAQRNTEYSERIEHQAATIDVLKAMSASPGDPNRRST